MGRGLLFYTSQDGGEVVVDELGYDDANNLHRLHLAMTQALGQYVGGEVMLTGILLNSLPPL